MSLQKYIDKAEVLIEALPYITKFNGKIIVIKYGGSAMLDEELKRKVIEDIVLLKMVGFKPIIVHGGGKEISKWVKKSGMEPNFIEGLRVTDEATIELVEMVLGKVNNELVRLVHSLGVKALGVSGMDGDLLQVDKKIIEAGDIGFVGDVKQVNPQVIYDLLDDDYLPIVYPVGIGDDGKPYNINADEAAGAIAKAIGAEKLAFLTDTEGVYMDINDPDSRISQLGVEEAQKLIEEGVIAGGMIPKIMNCVEAVEGGVNRVHILDGRLPHCVLLEIFTNKGIGTMILKDSEVEK
ncbi:MAG: acetylglutamate kinase [Firmicutes bacterium]|nr:acetylglutamate kinase [Bacillota bacterium]